MKSGKTLKKKFKIEKNEIEIHKKFKEFKDQGLTLNKKLFKPKCQNEKNTIQNITENQRGKKC